MVTHTFTAQCPCHLAAREAAGNTGGVRPLPKKDTHDVRATQRHMKPVWPGEATAMLTLTDLKTCNVQLGM